MFLNLNMIKSKKIFYSPSKKDSNNKYKKISTSSLNKKTPKVKIKQTNFLNSTTTKKDNKKEIINIEKSTINKINETLLFLNSKKFDNDSIKSKKKNNKCSYSSIFVDRLKNNQKLKEKNIFLKNLLKKLKSYHNYTINKKQNIQKNEFINNSYNNLNYYNNLKKENIHLNNINKYLRDEYSMLKLEESNNINIKKLLLNKDEIVNKIKSLNYSLTNFLELLSTNSNKTPSLKNSSSRNPDHSNYLNKTNNKHVLLFENKDIKNKSLNNFRNNINKSYYKSDIQYMSHKILNMTDNNNIKKNLNKNDNKVLETSKDLEVIIPLKRFEKTEYNKFKIQKKMNSEMKRDTKLIFLKKNKNIKSFKSIECNKSKKNKQIKSSNINKNKLPFKINNLVNTSTINKSVKIFPLNHNKTSSNVRQNERKIKPKDKNIKKTILKNKK